MKYRYENLRELMTSILGDTISRKQAEGLVAHCRDFELRRDHPTALNSPYIGVARVYFLPGDKTALFDIMDGSLDKLAKERRFCKTVNTNHRVASDPYNLANVWIVHLLRNASGIPKNLSLEAQTAVLKMLHYKFFTSRANHLFPYGTNESQMVATIESLSGKFDIRQPETDTWRKLFTVTAQRIVQSNSLHAKTLDEFQPDGKVFYVLTDIQTRIRHKLKLIKNTYNEVREAREKVGSYRISDSIDGEQLIRSVESLYDQMTRGVGTSALSLETFVNDKYVKVACGLSNNVVSPDLFRRFLGRFSDIAVSQHRAGKADELDIVRGMELAKGYRALIRMIIAKTYSSVLRRRDVNPDSKLSILDKTQSQYRASRISDEGVIATKENVSAWVDKVGLVKRSETKGALRIAFITYIILMSFDYM